MRANGVAPESLLDGPLDGAVRSFLRRAAQARA